MVQSLQCKFTMGMAINNWNKYWKVVLHGGNNIEAKTRYDGYMRQIQEAIAKGEHEEEMAKRRKSSGVGGNKKVEL